MVRCPRGYFVAIVLHVDVVGGKEMHRKKRRKWTRKWYGEIQCSRQPCEEEIGFLYSTLGGKTGKLDEAVNMSQEVEILYRQLI